MTTDWLDDFLTTHTRIVLSERIEVPGMTEIDAEVVNAVSWRRLLRLVDANNIRHSDKYRVDFALATPKGRGRVAMNINNSLRGAARRRGGLYAVSEDGHKVWYKAPSNWLKTQVEQDFSEPSEDPDGNPL